MVSFRGLIKGCLIKNVPRITGLMQNNSKLTFTVHPIRCTEVLGTSTYFQMKIFLNLKKRKGLLQHTVKMESPH